MVGYCYEDGARYEKNMYLSGPLKLWQSRRTQVFTLRETFRKALEVVSADKAHLGASELRQKKRLSITLG